jgi:integrase
MAIALTAAAVEKLKATSARQEIADGLLPGLYLIIQPSGAKSWAVRYRRNGKPRKLTLGSFPKLELADARKQARAALLQAQTGGDPALEKKIERKRSAEGKDTFEAVARLFIERHQKPKNRSWRETARILGIIPDPANRNPRDPKTFVLAKGGITARWRDRKMAEIKRAEIIALLDDIVDGGAPIAANRTLAALRKLFNWCMERDLIEASPCGGVKPPAPEKRKDRYLSNSEIRWFWQAADEETGPFGVYAKVLLLTGQRKSEILNMEVPEIDGEGVLVLPSARTKNKREHAVPLCDTASALLASVQRVSGKREYYFSTNGITPLSGFSKAQTRFRKRMLELAREEQGPSLEIKSWSWHTLRHTFKTWMQEARVDKDVRNAVQNHYDDDMDSRYGHYSFLREKRQVLSDWEAYVLNAISRKGAEIVKLRA